MARDNFVKYGNPDGYGHFHVSIALPAVIMEQEYQVIVLIVFFCLIVGAIPGYFYLSLTQEEKDVGGVDVRNRRVFLEMVDESITGKKILGIICQGIELESVKVRSKQELSKLLQLKEKPEIKSVLPSKVEFKDEKGEMEMRKP